MKSLSKAVGILLFLTHTASHAASLWTFDELATPEDIPGLNYAAIPNGYVRVQGLLGTTLLYDNTFTVYRSAPTFINFNYEGVDRVVFISSPAQPFALDNLAVTVPEPELTTVGMFACGLLCYWVVAFKRGASKA